MWLAVIVFLLTRWTLAAAGWLWKSVRRSTGRCQVVRVVRRLKFFPEQPAASDQFAGWPHGGGGDATALLADDGSSGLEPAGWSLYAVDATTATFVWCDPRGGVDLLTASPFYYQAQFLHARYACSVPIEQLPDVVAALRARLGVDGAPGPDIVVVPSTGRCGSTLLSNALSMASRRFVSISEPDCFTNLHQLRADGAIADRHYRVLLDCLVDLVALPYCSTATHVFIKLRAPFALCQDLAAARPAVRFLFMYRSAAAVVPSFYSAFASFLGGVTPAQLLAEPFVASASKALLQRQPTSDERGRCLAALAGILAEPALSANHSSAIFSMWLCCCAQYLDDLFAGVPIASLRYEDLVADPDTTLLSVFDFLGVARCDVDLPAALGALEKDSQQGHRISAAKRDPAVMQQARQNFQAVADVLAQLLARHPIITSFDVRLPATL